MKILLSFLLVTLCTAVLSETDPTTVPTETTTLVTDASTESTTSATPETTASTTSAAPETTASTTPPVPETTASTTDASSTTTAQPVTTSSSVTTAFPAPEKCSWNITQNGVTCIRADLKMQFIIPNEGRKSLINLGCGANSSKSDCSSNETQTLVLFETNQYNLTMVFEKDADKVFVRNITFDYALPGGENGSVANNDKLFTVKVGNSYLCNSQNDVHLENVTMEISYIHIQAFGAKDNENFGSAEECEADDKVSDIVPIAVGVALAALIIIVLIAYLVGRRRSRQRGYQSV